MYVFFGYVALVILALLAGAYAGIYLGSLVMPEIKPVALHSSPNPARSYEEAMVRFEALQAEEMARRDIDEGFVFFHLC